MRWHICACNMGFASSFVINWQFRRIDHNVSHKPVSRDVVEWERVGTAFSNLFALTSLEDLDFSFQFLRVDCENWRNFVWEGTGFPHLFLALHPWLYLFFTLINCTYYSHIINNKNLLAYFMRILKTVNTRCPPSLRFLSDRLLTMRYSRSLVFLQLRTALM